MDSSRLRPFKKTRLRSPEAPIRAELFSVERLEQHAESLAAAQRIGPNRRWGNPLANRLYDNARALDAAYRAIARTSSAHRPLTPAARWLVDSFHIVNEQIREITDDLPPGYYRLLPKLADGPLQGYPRVSGIAWALVAHTDSAFDIQKLTRFVDAYQRVQPLTIGELWALAITLRITLVENLAPFGRRGRGPARGKAVGRYARGPDIGLRQKRSRTGIDNFAEPWPGAMVDRVRRRTLLIACAT